MGREGGRPQRLVRAATGTAGKQRGDGEIRSTQDTVLATRAEIRRRGAAQVRGIAGWGRRGERQGSHAGKPGRIGWGWCVQDASLIAGATRDRRAGTTRGREEEHDRGSEMRLILWGRRTGKRRQLSGRKEESRGGAQGNQTGVGGGGGDSDSIGDRRAGDPRYLMTDKNTRGCNQSV